MEKETEDQAKRRALAAEASERARTRSQRDQARAALDQVEYVPGRLRMQRRTVKLGAPAKPEKPIEAAPLSPDTDGTASAAPDQFLDC
jgi:hypothetical protein